MQTSISVINIDLSVARDKVPYYFTARFIWISGDGALNVSFGDDKALFHYTGNKPFFMSIPTYIEKIYITNTSQASKSATIRYSNTIKEAI